AAFIVGGGHRSLVAAGSIHFLAAVYQGNTGAETKITRSADGATRGIWVENRQSPVVSTGKRIAPADGVPSSGASSRPDRGGRRTLGLSWWRCAGQDAIRAIGL